MMISSWFFAGMTAAAFGWTSCVLIMTDPSREFGYLFPVAIMGDVAWAATASLVLFLCLALRRQCKAMEPRSFKIIFVLGVVGGLAGMAVHQVIDVFNIGADVLDTDPIWMRPDLYAMFFSLLIIPVSASFTIRRRRIDTQAGFPILRIGPEP